MQLNKLTPLAACILAGLLSACGGGGGDDAPPPKPAAPPPPPAITVTAVTLHSSTTTTIADQPIQFDGGVCGGGTGARTQTWDFGDTPAAGAINTVSPTHTYATDGKKTVKVTCTDSVSTAPKVASMEITVLPAAMAGFLGKTWTTYAKVDATNHSPYPVAGLTESGDVYGVWLRKNSSSVTEAVASKTSFSSSSWSTPALLATTGSVSPYNVWNPGQSTAAMDVAVAPTSGRAMAAWLAGSSIWYATRDIVTGDWSTPTEIAATTVKTDASASIKVVINNAGDAAIAYCESDTSAKVITISGGTRKTPVPISKLCGVIDDKGMFGFQRHRAFDIAIDNKPTATVYSLGVRDGSTPLQSVVYEQSYTVTGGWTGGTNVSSVINTSVAPGAGSFESLSYSLSPNGDYAIAAWSQVEFVTSAAPAMHHVYTNIKKKLSGATTSTWGTTASAVKGQTPTNHYKRPLVAMNDKGHVFLSMIFVVPPSGLYSTIVHNYDASVPGADWSDSATVFNMAEYNASDIAIDKWGTGLITANYAGKTQALTFSKAGVMSGFTVLSPNYPNDAFRYQTMRALPDGRAVLTTAVYDSVTHTGSPVLSGYSLLK